jgi:hypothetical protein
MWAISVSGAESECNARKSTPSSLTSLQTWMAGLDSELSSVHLELDSIILLASVICSNCLTSLAPLHDMDCATLNWLELLQAALVRSSSLGDIARRAASFYLSNLFRPGVCPDCSKE